MNTVFAIMQSFQNCGLFITPMIIGFMRDTSGTYHSGFYVLLGIEIAALLSILPVYLSSKAMDEFVQILRLPSNEVEKKVISFEPEDDDTNEA